MEITRICIHTLFQSNQFAAQRLYSYDYSDFVENILARNLLVLYPSLIEHHILQPFLRNNYI